MDDNKVFHECRSAGRKFTQDEWGEYCRQTREEPELEILTQIGKYFFNAFDICLNPDVVRIGEHGYTGYWAEIQYAECGNGVWVFGIDYCTGNGGGGFGASWSDELVSESKAWHAGYASEVECKRAACDELVKRVLNSEKNQKTNKLIDKIIEYKRNISRPQVVQLELF